MNPRERRYRTERRDRRVLIGGRLTAPVRPEKHGLASTYTNHSCRCLACSTAWAAYRGRAVTT